MAKSPRERSSSSSKMTLVRVLVLGHGPFASRLTPSQSTLHVSLFTLCLCRLFVLVFYFINIYFRVLVDDVNEVVVRVERRKGNDVLADDLKEWDRLIKQVSLGGNSIFTCSLLFKNRNVKTFFQVELIQKLIFYCDYVGVQGRAVQGTQDKFAFKIDDPKKTLEMKMSFQETTSGKKVAHLKNILVVDLLFKNGTTRSFQHEFKVL